MTEFAIDYSSARPDPSAIKAAGYSGVFRYVCVVNAETKPKIVRADEVHAIREAGLDLTLNWEWFEDRPTQGFQAGVDDAHVADHQADAVGYPLECAVYYSVDFAATWDVVSEYFRGVHTASRRPVGVYGGLGIIREAQNAGFATFGWVTNAASWSGHKTWGTVRDAALADPAHFHVLQHLHPNTPLHVAGVDDLAFDPDTVINPEYGQWAAGDDMPLSQEDLSKIGDAIDAKNNRVIGTLQTNMKQEWIPAIVSGVLASVQPLLKDPSAVNVDEIVDAIGKRLSG